MTNVSPRGAHQTGNEPPDVGAGIPKLPYSYSSTVHLKDIRSRASSTGLLKRNPSISQVTGRRDSLIAPDGDGKVQGTCPYFDTGGRRDSDMDDIVCIKNSPRESHTNNNSHSLVQAHGNRSIEIFFGSLRTFNTFYQMLCEKGMGSGFNNEFLDEEMRRVKPNTIKKLVLVGHPVTSFAGLNLFVKLVEAWITNCTIPEAKWSDFEGLIHLHKLYIYNCQLNKIDALYFQNLKVLWLAGNNLTSLSFLGHGMNSLNELNVARNEISCISEDHISKCTNLQRLNLSGNPLCIIQDVQAVKVLPHLQILHLADPMYGKCPVATLCDSRPMILNVLSKLASLDGRTVTASELVYVHEYMATRCLFYYTNSVQRTSSYVALRKMVMKASNKQMESIGMRLLELVSIAAKYRRTISSVEVVPIFTNAKNLMKDQLMKIENRMLKLKEWKEVTTRRLELISQISRWEQETEKWMRWLEYQTYGNTQCRISHSVHGALVADGGNLCITMHELLSALACPGLWPPSSLLKVESIVVIRDKGMEAGMERVFFDNFALKDEPKFVPPPVDPLEEKRLSQVSSMNATMSPTSPYCPPPTVSKPVSTYTTPDYKPPPPVFPFPESILGLPERSQPLFMFLVVPAVHASNPLFYLQRILIDKSRNFKEVRVTNCLWWATSCASKHIDSTFSVVIVVKVLEECLQPTNLDRRGYSTMMRHGWDCSIFSFKRPLAFSPAYVITISFTHDNKQAIWHRVAADDDDIMIPAETALASLSSKIQLHGHPPPAKPGRAKLQAHMKRIGDGFHCDLCSVQVNVSKDGKCEIADTILGDKTTHTPVELSVLTKLIGKEPTQFLTSLDLSGNRLGLTVGLDSIPTLKKLNLSYNNLTTLTGLRKLPNLIELKAGWNSLRFLHSNAATLAWVCPRLMTVELLPNPFQDIRDLAHIPVLLHKVLPLLHRVDVWTSPFSPPNHVIPFAPPSEPDHSTYCNIGVREICAVVCVLNAGSNIYSYNDCASKCLTDLEQLPESPPKNEKRQDAGIDLNLADNYLSSASLMKSHFCTKPDWNTALVKLQLQENMLTTLDWLVGLIFPNCLIVNLSVNQLDELDNLSSSFPNVRHLHLAGNPLPCEYSVLNHLNNFPHLITLDCSTTPLAGHPDYGTYILKHIPTLKLLDGLPTQQWETMETVEKTGGVITPDWLEDKVGNRDWGSLNQLSLANCGIQKISLPPHCLSKLMTLDLQDNTLTNFGNLASLPSLKVLCVSYNCVSSLGGSPCPVCYAHTAQSQAAIAQKIRASKSSTSSTFYEWNGKTSNGLSNTIPTNKGTGFDPFGLPIAHPGTKTLPCHVKNDLRTTGASAWGFNTGDGAPQPPPEKLEYSSPPRTPLTTPRKTLSKHVFPKLEVLIMAHNGLTTLSDLHLHAMQNLQTIVLNCNNLTTLQGLENLPSVRAIVLDHNRIRDVPYNSLAGCKSLKYLHLEHNKITSLPRLPHLSNLTALYVAYNKIQSLTDLSTIAGTAINELTMAGNPLATRSDYRLNVVARLSQLTTLDGKDVATERMKLGELANKWFAPPSCLNSASPYRESSKTSAISSNSISNNNSSGSNSGQSGSANDIDFSLRVKSLGSHLYTHSPRSMQYKKSRPP